MKRKFIAILTIISLCLPSNIVSAVQLEDEAPISFQESLNEQESEAVIFDEEASNESAQSTPGLEEVTVSEELEESEVSTTPPQEIPQEEISVEEPTESSSSEGLEIETAVPEESQPEMEAIDATESTESAGTKEDTEETTESAEEKDETLDSEIAVQEETYEGNIVTPETDPYIHNDYEWTELTKNEWLPFVIPDSDYRGFLVFGGTGMRDIALSSTGRPSITQGQLFLQDKKDSADLTDTVFGYTFNRSTEATNGVGFGLYNDKNEQLAELDGNSGSLKIDKLEKSTNFEGMPMLRGTATISNDKLNVTVFVTLTVNKKGRMISYYSIKNNAAENLNATFVKAFQTWIKSTQNCPTYFLGKDVGLRIYAAKDSANLDFLIDGYYNQPINFSGHHPNTDSNYLTYFDGSVEGTGTESMDFAPGEMVTKKSGIGLKWPKFSLKENEIIDFRHDIHYQVESNNNVPDLDFNVEKTVENVSKSGQEVFHVGDEVKYTVSVAKNQEDLLLDVVFSDTISTYLDKLSTIVVESDNGAMATLDVTQVFDEKTRQLKIDLGSVSGKSFQISYHATITHDAAEQEIYNQAFVAGTPFLGKPIEKNAEVTIAILPAVIGPTDPDHPDPSEPVEPLDPEHPDPENPIEPEVEEGALTLDFASNLYFGINYVSNKDQDYHAFAQPIKDLSVPGGIRYVANYVQLTDRRQSKAGWTLSVKQNGQFSGKDKFGVTHQLTGATLEFQHGRENTVDPNPHLSYVKESFTLSVDGSQKNGDSEIIMSASASEGENTWIYSLGENKEMQEEKTVVKDENRQLGEEIAVKNPNITLNVPKETTTRALKYKTSLTWTLSDVPLNIEGK